MAAAGAASRPAGEVAGHSCASAAGLAHIALLPFARRTSHHWRMDMLKALSLSKSFGSRQAVASVSFSLSRAETVAFLGPNGAGKSTTLRMLSGYLEPDTGDAWISGASIQLQRIRAQRFLGYLPEGAPLYPELSGRDFLAFLARVHGLEGKAARDAVGRAAEAAGIGDRLAQPIDTLSKGYRRRLSLAGAIIHDPPVLILDEPTDGLDPHQKIAMRDLIRRMGRQKAILISTHQLDEVEAMCSRAILIARGRIVADLSLAELARTTPGGRLEDAFLALTTPGPAP